MRTFIATVLRLDTQSQESDKVRFQYTFCIADHVATQTFLSVYVCVSSTCMWVDIEIHVTII